MALISKFQNIRIGKRLISSFAVILLLIIAYTAFIVMQLRNLEQQIDFLYKHPFKTIYTIDAIANSMLRFNYNAEKMMKSADQQTLFKSEGKIEDRIKETYQYLDVLRESYLGDPKPIDELQKILEEWQGTREKFVSMHLAGQKDEANAFLQAKVIAMYKAFNAQLIDINLASRAKAKEFRVGAEKIYLQVLISTVLLALVLIIIVYLIAILNVKSLLPPLNHLTKGAEEVEKGNFQHQVSIVSKDELGELSDAFNKMSESIKTRNQKLQEKNAENEKLLLSILPRPIAERLKQGEEPIADAFADVSVLFADLVHFTEFSDGRPPRKVVEILNELFTMFDEIANRHGVEKIKTIGDSYMAVCGLIEPRKDHTDALLAMALDMISGLRLLNKAHNTNFLVRIGIHSGPVIAGIIGKGKFIYDLWGDTVNIASRMESHGIPGRIQLSDYAYKSLIKPVSVEEREPILVKGKGMMKTYFVVEPNAPKTELSENSSESLED